MILKVWYNKKCILTFSQTNKNSKVNNFDVSLLFLTDIKQNCITLIRQQFDNMK